MTSYKSFLSQPWDSQTMFSLVHHVVQNSACIKQRSCGPGTYLPILVANIRLQKVRVCSLETKVQQMRTMELISEMFFLSE